MSPSGRSTDGFMATPMSQYPGTASTPTAKIARFGVIAMQGVAPLCRLRLGNYTAATTAAVAKSQTDAGMFQPRMHRWTPRSHRSTQGVTLVYPTPGAMHLHSLLPLSTRYPPKWSAAMCKGLGYATVHVRVYVQRGWQGPAGTALTPENLPGTTWCEQTISTSPSRGRDWQPPEVVYSPSSYDPGLSQH